MANSSSGSSSSGTRRCPKCRRRMKRLALRCFNCNWTVPYRQFYLGLIALGAGVLGVALFLSAQRFFGGPTSSPGAMNVTKPKPAGK